MNFDDNSSTCFSPAKLLAKLEDIFDWGSQVSHLLHPIHTFPAALACHGTLKSSRSQHVASQADDSKSQLHVLTEENQCCFSRPNSEWQTARKQGDLLSMVSSPFGELARPCNQRRKSSARKQGEISFLAKGCLLFCSFVANMFAMRKKKFVKAERNTIVRPCACIYDFFPSAMTFGLWLFYVVLYDTCRQRGNRRSMRPDCVCFARRSVSRT